MMVKGLKYVYLLLCLFVGFVVTGQPVQLTDTSTFPSTGDTIPHVQLSRSSTPFTIGEIVIEGNRRTKPFIILRELPFKSGDSIQLAEVVKHFEIARQQLMNTTLFNEVVVALKSFRGYYLDVVITVKERWYVFPIPYLKPIDRNLTEWAKQGYDMDRLNYGFKFTYYNFTGRNDKLRLWLITGYTKQIEFQYDQPYADQTLKHGYKVGFSYSTNKEVNYASDGNQQLFIDSLSDIRRWHGSIEYTYRPRLRTFHGLRLGFTHQEVDSNVVFLNPDYYGEGRTSIVYPELEYTLKHVNVDYIPFPLTGWMGEMSLLRRGIGTQMDLWQFAGKLTKGWKLAPKLYFSWQGYGVVKAPFKQPYINQRLFGYGDLYLRGLEKYVIDGVAGVMARHTVRREIFNFSIPTFLKSTSHDRIPFKIYARTFSDIGYAHNPNMMHTTFSNSLSNRLLYTGGFGIDVVTFYDFIIRLDYSFNQLGQKDLFLHIKNDF